MNSDYEKNGCEVEFKRWLARYGRSRCDAIMRVHFKKRIEPTDRPDRVRLSAAQRRAMYASQKGFCSICREHMMEDLRVLDVDHVDPNLTGKDFNARKNLALAHPGCNRQKSSKSIPAQAKWQARTMSDILAGYQPTTSDLDPEKPPQGGSGVSRQ